MSALPHEDDDPGQAIRTPLPPEALEELRAAVAEALAANETD